MNKMNKRMSNQVVRLQVFRFGGGHHKRYDWRDDPKANQNLEVDPRMIGWDISTYKQPHEGTATWSLNDQYPSAFNFYDLKQNHRPENVPAVLNNPMTVGQDDKEHMIDHLADYESEDCDFQPDTFTSQHFRSKGPLAGWVIIGFLPFLYFGNEFFFEHYPDEDYWRISRPPPLDYPDEEDTEDTQVYADYRAKDVREMIDAGQINDIWYDIKDGKKVYRKWAGVNQPMELI